MESYKIVVTAVRGDKGEGYVAIDDFEFKVDEDICETIPVEAVPNPTNPPTDIPTDAPDKFPDCRFEEDTCGWVVDDSQSLVWMRTQVSDLTQMGYDAPKRDHDGNHVAFKMYFPTNFFKGFFMYVSAKHGQEDDHPTIESPTEGEVSGCMIFYFSIFVSIPNIKSEWHFIVEHT